WFQREVLLKVSIPGAEAPPLAHLMAGRQLHPVSFPFEAVGDHERAREGGRVTRRAGERFETPDIVVVVVKRGQIERGVFANLRAVAQLISDQFLGLVIGTALQNEGSGDGKD